MTLTILFEKEARRVLEFDIFLAMTSAYKKGAEFAKNNAITIFRKYKFGLFTSL